VNLEFVPDDLKKVLAIVGGAVLGFFAWLVHFVRKKRLVNVQALVDLIGDPTQPAKDENAKTLSALVAQAAAAATTAATAATSASGAAMTAAKLAEEALEASRAASSSSSLNAGVLSHVGSQVERLSVQVSDSATSTAVGFARIDGRFAGIEARQAESERELSRLRRRAADIGRALNLKERAGDSGEGATIGRDSGEV